MHVATLNKKISLLCFVFIVSGTFAFSQGFLKASGRIIVNENGEKVILRSMGFGGWMLQEGYMFRLGNVGRQYLIKEKIQELIGEAKTNEFYNNWLTNHTRKIDIDSMAAWGFNSVRLPMHYNLYTLPVDKEPVSGQNTWIEKGFALTDSLLNWCKQNNMYLILDLHATPGGQGNDLPISDRDPAKPSLWQSDANQQKMIALWRKLAERYSNEPYIGGYDIINEPNWGFEDPKDIRGTEEKKNEPLRKLMIDITKAIREVDKKHIIIIEGNGFGNNYRGVLPAWDDNMVLSFHKYGNFNTTAAIQNFLNLSRQYNIPLWMGEFGENSNTWLTESIQLAETNNIGWAAWQLKKMGINNPLEIKVTPSYQLLLDYWNGKAAKPEPAQAEAALNELLNNLKLENNIYHKDVVDAMFRQVQSTATLPFKTNIITNNTTINAVDYDLGRQRFAYYDKDSASYHYTPGVNTTSNRGHQYRSDGVDIQKDNNGYYIFSIEDSEWMQYTLNVTKSGNYTISLNIATDNDSSKVSILNDNKLLVQSFALTNTRGFANWQNIIVSKKLHLHAGTNRLRIYADKGGFNLREIIVSTTR